VVALQALDRLSRALGGEVILPVSFSIISSFLESSMWQERFGALMSIAYLSEGSADLLETKIDLVIKYDRHFWTGFVNNRSLPFLGAFMVKSEMIM
jgi:hypothetical protein